MSKVIELRPKKSRAQSEGDVRPIAWAAIGEAFAVGDYQFCARVLYSLATAAERTPGADIVPDDSDVANWILSRGRHAQ